MQLEQKSRQLKPLPKNKAWLTENTELLTNEGWILISEVVARNLPLLTLDVDSRKTCIHNILSTSTMMFDGEVQYFEYPDIYQEFRYAFPLHKSDFLPSFEQETYNIYGRKKYKGILFNITIPTNVVFVRHPRVLHNGKSIIAKNNIVLDAPDILDDHYSHDEQLILDNQEPEIDPNTGLPVHNILFSEEMSRQAFTIGEEPESIPSGKAKTKKKKQGRVNKKRYRSLFLANYYPCRLSW